jgi:haloalkane dehalogenase
MVLHDWGSGLGFHYAMNHEEKINGLAFMEAIVKPMSWSDFGAQFKMGFKLLRTPGIGWFMIHVMNIFVNQILPQATIRQLTEQEKQRYRAPFKTIKSRKPIRQWPLEIPIDGKPADIHQIVETYSRKLQQSKIPKLLLYATPGGIINRENLEWCKTNLTNLNTVHVGKGIHYLQEDHPNIIGKELAQWYKGINAE